MRMKSILAVILVSLTYSCGQSVKSKNLNKTNGISTSVVKNGTSETHTNLINQENYIHNFKQYKTPKILIENSYPKGGGRTGPNGDRYGYGIFYSSIKNESDSTLKVSLKFPTMPTPMNNQANTQLNVFLSLDLWESKILDSLDYGIKDLSFFDNPQQGNRELIKTIKPNEKSYFYVAIQFNNATEGPVRTGLEIKDQEILYKVSYETKNETVLIPCGKFLFNQ